VAAAAQGARGLAEGLRSHGQQERPHPVGGDDARAALRRPARQRQAARQGAAGAPRRRGAHIRAIPGLTRAETDHPTTRQHTTPSTIDVLSKMHHRSDRQLVNSANPAWRQLHPNPGSEWSPAERFVSGPAPVGVQQGRL